MAFLFRAAGVLALLWCNVGHAADDKGKPADPVAQSVEALAASARKSIVVVTVAGRDGKQAGLGTGFVVGDGLIATNLHVIGEARPISVELADGKKHEVTAVHATDRASDLAILRVAVKELTPLPLGDSDTLKDGQAVVALGNPQGLKHSVVAGVVSGRREIDSRPMIQVAIPIEPGNSGGPMLDMQGRVHGILTIKSLVTANLGFAMPSNTLKPLLQKPNPVPMDKWLTIGTLDPREWQPLFGARWRQRSGRITVDTAGTGFGGRSVCIAQQAVPAAPFEAAVTLRLDDEAGAAGLIFHADGGDKHYGFYPTNGSLRLTRFDGPDVFSWRILANEFSPHYRRGDWNTLRVRVEKDRIRCYVNDELAIESTDNGLTQGKVGLAKFRETRAEFKNFQVAKEIPPTSVPAAVSARVTKAVVDLPTQAPPAAELVNKLAPEGPASVAVLRERAVLLEKQAAQLRLLALAVHQQRVLDELAQVVKKPDADIDLLHAALLLARLDNDELDVAAYRQEVDKMAREIGRGLPARADEKVKRAALNKYLFEDRGFHGSRSEYYHRSNSYLNEVIDDREGLPITLSVLYMELAGRLGLKVVGVPLPGHFMVRHEPAKGEPQLIDVFDGGKLLTQAEAIAKVKDTSGDEPRDKDFQAAAKKAILVRMLHNLLGLAQSDEDPESMLRYLDGILTVSPTTGPERFLRGFVRWRTNRRADALVDLDWLLDKQPEDVDLDKVRALRQEIQRPEK